MSQVTALLGPTNTGKTYAAIERLLAHQSGVMGFPLRLLARENYEKAVRLKGKDKVALITGEEKIIPTRAQYYMCTVESMPLDMGAEFVAIDEIQLAADPERGHVFTDRLLYMRGKEETMFLGAATIAPLLKQLLPDVEIRTAPRFSTLSYVAPKKLSRIPRRSAVIVFSASQVYETAEYLRVHRGGCAVVLGALSPRTRNAQVEMYQTGEVDYLVGTDAIGMGLNLDLEHVTFAKLRKFDGRHPRPLRADEVGQIAGRAGRHTRDGTFSTTPEVGGIEETLVSMVENHNYPPLRHLNWRNPNLSFDNLDALRRSLETIPNDPNLRRLRVADDQLALDALVKEDAVLWLCRSPAAVRMLWDVCQIPDFRKSLTDQHHALQQSLFISLVKEGHLPTTLVEEQIELLNKDDGDIDTLVNRIAAIRTWTYITHRGDWVAQADTWANRARAVDDKLSDALHKRLTQRFVDRRAAFLVQKLKGEGPLMCEIGEKGEVLVEGTPVGALKGLTFTPDLSGSDGDKAALLTAARRGLGPEIQNRLLQLENDNDGAYRLDEAGALLWREARVGSLSRGASLWAPEISIDANDFLDGAQKERIAIRLAPWLKAFLKNRLAPFYVLKDPRMTGSLKGLAYQMWEDGGLIMRPDKGVMDSLTETDKALMSELKIQVTRRAIFVRSVFNSKIWNLRGLLWSLFNSTDEIMPLPEFDQASLSDFKAFKGVQSYLRQFGFLAFGPKGQAPTYVRADGLDRLEGKLYALFKNGANGAFVMPSDIGEPLKLQGAALEIILSACGYTPTERPEGSEISDNFYRRNFGKRNTKQRTEGKLPKTKNKANSHNANKQTAKTDDINPDSPFAALAALKK